MSDAAINILRNELETLECRLKNSENDLVTYQEMVGKAHTNGAMIRLRMQALQRGIEKLEKP